MAMKTVMAWEPWSVKLIQEVTDLTRIHSAELRPTVTKYLRHDPDETVWEQMCRAGYIETLTVRTATRGTLVGYSIWVVVQHPNHRYGLLASNAATYLHKRLRHGWTGIKLIRKAKQELPTRRPEIKALEFSTDAANPMLAVMARLGFKLSEYKFIAGVD